MVTVAEEVAKDIKEISIAEFFERNRHLLGFDSKIKALLTCIKEAVDNSLDASESYAYYASKKKGSVPELPEIKVKIKELGEERYRITILDNGTGVVKEQIPPAFARLLYGSKFSIGKLKQGRGQQGIGISAALLYAQLTTGKSSRVVSKIDPKKPAYWFDLRIDIAKNMPEIVDEGIAEKFPYDHGTEITLEIEGAYINKGDKSPYEYMKRASIVNPHAKFLLVTPDNAKITFPRVSNVLPKEPKSIKPHPYGIEIGKSIYY